MQEFQNIFYQLPPFSRSYLTLVFILTALVTYFPFLNVEYFLLDANKVIYELQIWRIFSNAIFVGFFSSSFVFFMLLSSFLLVRLEKAAINEKKYPNFVMMIFYIWLFLQLSVFVYQYTYFTSVELIFALTYIDSKREPERMAYIWGKELKSNSIIRQICPFRFPCYFSANRWKYCA